VGLLKRTKRGLAATGLKPRALMINKKSKARPKKLDPPEDET